MLLGGLASSTCSNVFEIRDELLQVADTEGATVPIDRGIAFKRNAENFCKTLRGINSVTPLLQIGNATLADCRMCVDSLLQDVGQYRMDAQSYLYGCLLGKKCLAIDVTIAPDIQFESGVVKIQRGNVTGMTDAEKSASEKLRAPSTTTGNEVSHAAMSVEERIALRIHRRLDASHKYVNFDLILGSAAEVERL